MRDVDTKFRLMDPHLMHRLMQRTGTGARVTVRQLAADIGVAHGTIGNLLTGTQRVVPEATANAIARRIGVDVLVLFTPVGRSSEALAATQLRPESASA